MRKELLKMLAIVMLAFTAQFAMAQTYSFPVEGSQGFSMTNKTKDGARINYNLGQFSLNQINYRGEEMSEISIKAITIPNEAGLPNLPAESRMIAIPQGAKASLTVVRAEKQTFQNVNIAPALRIQAESEDPDMNYEKDPQVYSKNAFYPENPFTVGESYIRGVDAVTVTIMPFQYNPVTKELVVYSNVELAINYEGGRGHFGEDRLRSPYWDPILAAELMNYDQLPVIDYEARMQQWLRDGADGAEYVIVTPNNDAWAPYAQQLKEFRTKQGIITEVYRLDEMPATTTAMMKTWFHNAYQTWTIAPVAVLLLGDHNTNMAQGIPAETTPHPYSSTCITDNFYADAQGNDNLPDMVFSRLVAQNASELPILVGKQIEYEYTNPNMDPDFYTSPVTALGWQTQRWFQICSEVFGGYMRNHGYTPQRINCIYSGTPGSSWSSNQNTSMVVNYFGPSGVGYIPAQPSELGNWNNGSPEMVVQAVNNGTFWVQHRDHGLDEGWGEPAVRNNHIDQMNNVGKLPFVMSINCQTGMFNYTGSNGNCFTEKWMRRTYNGENAGAVGVLSPTEVSYSFVNDSYVWGVYDLFDGNFMPDYGPYQPAAPQTGNWMPAFGNVAGKYFLNQTSWPYNTDDKDITYTMFTAHCDAFLRIFTHVPQTPEVIHPEVAIAGLGEMAVSAPAGCTISLVVEDPEGGWQILAVTTATGDVQTIVFEPQLPPTEIHMVVTGQNYLRYEDVISVIPADGPYVVCDGKVINDQNGNGQLDFGETISLDITMRNVGSDPMDAFEAILESNSEYITITNGTAQFGAIAAGATQTLQNAFTFTVANNIPDNTSNQFTILVHNGDDTYISNLSIKAFAPIFQFDNMIITEVTGNGNGRLDPGETATLTYNVKNNGHSDANQTTVSMMLLSPYITVAESNVVFDNFAASSTQSALYNIAISDETPLGYSCNILMNVVSGNYSSSKDYTVKVGLILEDFEQGTLGQGWTNDASSPWQFVNTEPYEGNYCMKSGTISHNGTTNLTLQHEAGSNDTISFYYKVSSENNYDKLHFYIDNQERGLWSGTVAWTKASFPVSAGNHTYKWSYTKDSSVSSGSDCCWIDFVSLPAPKIMAGTAGNDITICEGNDAQIVGYAIHHQSLQWTTSGDGIFDNATIATPIYTPGTQDLIDRQVTLTITIQGNGNTIVDDMILSIVDNVSIENSVANPSYCAFEEPHEIGVTVSGDYTDFYWTTTGDGTFANADDFSTTYTPGILDIQNGVNLYANAVSEGCGVLSFPYPYELIPAPHLQLNLQDWNAVCQGEDLEIPYEALGFFEGKITFDLNGEPYTLNEGEAFMLPTAALEAGDYNYAITNLSNSLCDSESTLNVPFTVIARPDLMVEDPVMHICAGETARFEIPAVGGYGDNVEYFALITEFEEAVALNGNLLVLEFNNPEEFNQVHVDQLSAWTPEFGECVTDLDLTLSVVIDPEVTEQPVINGVSELDVFQSPTSVFNVTNNIPSNFSIEPETAGTLNPANDNLSVVITWDGTYKGQVTLTAEPVSVCNQGGSTMVITVKNSTGVDEFASGTRVYPNPTSEKVTIEAKGMTQVTVFSVLGQQVYQAKVDADSTDIDMSMLPAGTYMVRIDTNEGSSVEHISVIR